jgi:predicted phage terminase large subunit-like protein
LASILPGFNVHFSPETGSKDDRAIPVAAQAEAGNVYMVRAPWNDAFLAEAQLFPASEFKDQIDALSRAYAYLLTQNTRAVALEPAMIITQ